MGKTNQVESTRPNFGQLEQVAFNLESIIQVVLNRMLTTERAFLEELSVFYVAVTRARKQVYFSCSKRQRTKYGDRSKNISCFMKLPGMKY